MELVLSSDVSHKLYGYFIFILYPVKLVVLPARVRSSSGQRANIVKFSVEYLLRHDYLSVCSITLISSNYYLSLLLSHQANYSLVAKPITDEYNYSILQIIFRGRNVGQSLFLLHMKEIKAPPRPK